MSLTPELTQTYLNSLQLDFNLFKDSLKEVSDDMISEEFTQYPIFVAHQSEVKIGEIILDREELQSNFTFQASTFEEFVERKIIETQNKQRFIKAYKNPAEFCCIFLVTEYGAQYVFVPYLSSNKK